jgi:hypothetical protein
LGDFPKIGYYEHDNNPSDMDADFLLVEESKIPDVEAKLRDSYFTEPLTVRPYQDPSKLYFRASLVKDMEKLEIHTPRFQGFLPGKLPDSTGAKNK